MSVNKYSKEDINKAIPEVWLKLSDYLGLGLTWSQFLKDCKNRFKNFKGFKLIKTKYPPCWYAGFKGDKDSSYVYMAYHPEVRVYFQHHICHELVHLFRETVHQNKFKQVSLVSHLLDEALSDVIPTKITGKMENKLKKTGLYNLIDVCALEQMIYDMDDKEIRKIALMPRTEKELKELTFLVLKMISTKNYKNNIRKIWKTKIKEKVYY